MNDPRQIAGRRPGAAPAYAALLRMRHSRSARILFHSLFGLLLLWLFLRQVDGAEAAAILARAQLAPLLAGLVLYAADFYLRAVRFHLLVQDASGRTFRLRRTVGPFVASFGISDLLPLRAGDVFRFVWFHRNLEISKSSVLGAMLIERYFDLGSLLLLGCCVLAWYFHSTLAIALLVAMFAGVFVAPRLWLLLAVPLADRMTVSMKGDRGRRLAEGIRATIETFGVLRSPGAMFRLLGLSLLCWLLEAGLFVAAWVSLGGSLSQWAPTMAAFTTSTLGTLLPGFPGHFGTFELFGMEAFRQAGVDGDFAAAVLLLAHLLLWAPTALFAIGWLLPGRRRNWSGKSAEHSQGALP